MHCPRSGSKDKDPVLKGSSSFKSIPGHDFGATDVREVNRGSLPPSSSLFIKKNRYSYKKSPVGCHIGSCAFRTHRSGSVGWLGLACHCVMLLILLLLPLEIRMHLLRFYHVLGTVLSFG